MATFPISARTLPTGDTLISAFAIPVGTHKAVLTLDVASMTAGQVVYVLVEYFDGTDWAGFQADFNGPWRDRQNVLHNDVALTFSFGSIAVNGVFVDRVSVAGWQVRAKFTVVNGPFNTAGGSIVLT